MNIIITGGSNGIGKYTAMHLAGDKKNKILITGRNEATLRAVSESSANRNIQYLVSDLRYLNKDISAFREAVENVFAKVDILINNAGTLYSKKFAEISDKEAHEMMEVNFFAPVLLIKTLMPLFGHKAHVLNISSMGGYQGSVKFPGLSYYSASKAALACITECLAAEFAGSDISFNCLALGSAQTEMLQKAFPDYKAPLSAEEMGKFVAEFAVSGNRFFNGKILPVALTTP
jgi:short-subunit dehydrogenase